MSDNDKPDLVASALALLAKVSAISPEVTLTADDRAELLKALDEVEGSIKRIRAIDQRWSDLIDRITRHVLPNH
jgi:hypothetical protein